MKIEIHKNTEDDFPTIVVECLICGGLIVVRERDFLFSKPLHCNECLQDRTLSYREYILARDSIASELLACSVSRLSKTIKQTRRHHQ